MSSTTVLKYVKLPCRYDASILEQEVNAIQATWIDHYNNYGYTGSWKAIPLRSKGGNVNQIIAESESGFQDTEILKQCSYIQEVLSTLPGSKLSVRLLNLQAGSIIKEHRDLELSFEKGEARLHIPVITHPDVEFWIDNERIRMQEGECWYINANLPHRASNLSEINRIHLVVDVVVDSEVEKFFSAADKSTLSSREDHEAYHMMEKTIAELLRSKDPRMHELGFQLRTQHINKQETFNTNTT